MNDQPNKDEWQARRSEWTWQTVDSMIRESYESPGGESLQRIADAHNASLDELRIASNASLESAKRECAKQIAAEKELTQKLIDQVTSFREALAAEREGRRLDGLAYQKLLAAEKERYGKLLHDWNVLEEQLAAESLRANQKEGAFMVASDANQKLLEKVRELEEELNEAVKLLKLQDIDAAIAKLENK